MLLERIKLINRIVICFMIFWSKYLLQKWYILLNNYNPNLHFHCSKIHIVCISVWLLQWLEYSFWSVSYYFLSKVGIFWVGWVLFERIIGFKNNWNLHITYKLGDSKPSLSLKNSGFMLGLADHRKAYLIWPVTFILFFG